MRKDRQLYRCDYTPVNLDGHPVPSESGVRPHVDVLAVSAEEAMRLAQTKTGCPVDMPVRIEDAPTKTRRAATVRRPRPVIKLTTGAAMLAALNAAAGASR